MYRVIDTKFEDMTATIERAFVDLAKKGVKGSAKALFNIYKDVVREHHEFTPIGKTPSKFGYSWNPNHVEYAEVSDEVYQNFLDAIESFDYSQASPTAKLPFLAYFRSNMGYRALDFLDDEKKYNSKFVPLSTLKESAGPNDDRTAEEILEERMIRDYVYNPEKEERKLAAENDLLDFISDKVTKDKKAHKFITSYREVISRPNGDKNTMTKVSNLLNDDQTSERKKVGRTNMYYYKNKLMAHLDEEDTELYNDIVSGRIE